MAAAEASDSRKRTLEALEKRFAFAKAELLHQDKKNKITINEEDDGKPKNVEAGSASNDRKPPPSSSHTHKKVNFRFAGYAIRKEIEEAGAAYDQLSHTVNKNLLTNNDASSAERGSSIDSILHELLRKGDSAQQYMQGSRILKIDNTILLDNRVKGHSLSSGSQARALQKRSKRSKKRMSMKQHKKHGSLDLPIEFHKFDIFKPMHEMWKDYIMQLLKTTGTNQNQLAQCLLDADLHGAIILVVECKITNLTGTSGIMIRETAETFGIITEKNKFRVVPKKISVFVFQVDRWKVTLHGDKLSSRKVGL